MAIFINTIQIYLFLISFAVLIGEIVDFDDTKSFRCSVFQDGTYLLGLALLNCLLEYIVVGF